MIATPNAIPTASELALGDTGERRSSSQILLAAIAIGAAAALGASFMRYRHTQERAISARRQLTTLVADANEVFTLRQSAEAVSWNPKPANDALALVNAALARAGIPAGTHLRGLGEAGDTELSVHTDSQHLPLRRQSLYLQLDGLTTSEIGAFLVVWGQCQTLWSVDRLELSHHPDPGYRGGDSGAIDPEAARFDVRLTLGCAYVDADRSSSAGPGDPATNTIAGR